MDALLAKSIISSAMDGMSCRAFDEAMNNIRFDILFNFGESISLDLLAANIKKYPEFQKILEDAFNDNLRQKSNQNEN